MRIIDQEEARAHILARQGLSRPFAGPLEALHVIFAIQTQYASSLPIALSCRTSPGKRRYDCSNVLKSWTLRSTLHAHTPEDHAIAIPAVRGRFRERIINWFAGELGFSKTEIADLELAVLDSLADGPKTRQEIHERVPLLRQIPYAGWGMDLKALAYAGKIKIIVAESGTTRFAIHDLVTEWTEEAAVAELMRRYFKAFGPATAMDFRYWTGLTAFVARRAFNAIRDELTEVQVQGLEGRRFMIGDLDPHPIPKTILLAKFDPLTLGHYDRAFLIDARDRERVFRKAGQVEAGILIDGRFRGTWRLNRQGSRGAVATVEPFRTIPKANMPAIKRKAEIAAKALGLKLTDIQFTSP